MNLSARYEIGLYSAEHACAFARAWCSRMQFLTNHADAVGNMLHVCTSDELGAWIEPEGVSRAERDLAHVKAAQRRIRQIRALK